MEFGFEFWGVTFSFLGKLMIAVTALLTHRVIVKEKGIDKIALHNLKLEVSTGVLGLIFLIVGYALHFLHFSGA